MADAVRFARSIICAMPLLASAGCAGHFVVKPVDPASTTPGFRYYLPKPYLVVTNMNLVADDSSGAAPKKADAAADSAQGQKKDKDAGLPDPAAPQQSNNVTSVKLIWLPDTAHPYAVTIAGAGIGTFKGGLQLSNGWMLTNVSEESDAKIAETMTAVAGLVGGVLTPGTKANKGLDTKPMQARPFLYLFEVDIPNHKLTKVDTSLLNDAIPQSSVDQNPDK